MANNRNDNGNGMSREEAGKKGGQKSGGNFADDPKRASEAGKKGGENSHGGRNSWLETTG